MTKEIKNNGYIKKLSIHVTKIASAKRYLIVSDVISIVMFIVII